MHCKQDQNCVSPEMKLCGLVPNFHIPRSFIFANTCFEFSVQCVSRVKCACNNSNKCLFLLHCFPRCIPVKYFFPSDWVEPINMLLYTVCTMYIVHEHSALYVALYEVFKRLAFALYWRLQIAVYTCISLFTVFTKTHLIFIQQLPIHKKTLFLKNAIIYKQFLFSCRWHRFILPECF